MGRGAGDGAKFRAWEIENLNLGWLKNVELPIARALDMEAVIDWPGRTGQPWKPGGAVEFVQGQIAKEEAKLAAALGRIGPGASGGPGAPPVQSAPPAPGTAGAQGGTWEPSLGGFHAPGYQPGADSQAMAEVLARMVANIERRAAARPSANEVPPQFAPTPSGFGSDRDERPGDGEDGGTGGQISGRYFAPGVMAQAINRITRRSTGELVYLQAEKQTAELQGIRRELQGIRSEMANPIEVPVEAPGRFARN